MNTMKLADARPGQRLRDRFGNTWLREDGDGASMLPHTAAPITTSDENLGPFVPIPDEPPRWQFASTPMRPDVDDPTGWAAVADPPPGDGWEPLSVDAGRLWWKRRAT